MKTIKAKATGKKQTQEAVSARNEQPDETMLPKLPSLSLVFSGDNIQLDKIIG